MHQSQIRPLKCALAAASVAACALAGSIALLAPAASAAAHAERTATGLTTAHAASAACPGSGIDVWINTNGNGAAGSFFYQLNFTNLSGSTCTLYGYPGVSVVTSPSGSQVGPQAVRIPTFSPQLVTIAAGATVHATMQMPNPGVIGASVCVPQTVNWLRVFPPGEFTAMYISVPASANPVQICTGKHLGKIIPLGIYVVMPSATGT